MLIVKIEMWPHGDELKAREIGRVEIINDGTGDQSKGSYDVQLAKGGEYSRTPGVWKSGKVTGFDRLRRGPYDLLLLALNSLIGNRNGVAPPVNGDDAEIRESLKEIDDSDNVSVTSPEASFIESVLFKYSGPLSVKQKSWAKAIIAKYQEPS